MTPSRPASSSSLRRAALLLALVAPLAASASEAPSGSHSEPLPSDSKVFHPWAGGVDPRPYLKHVTRTNLDNAEKLLLHWGGLVTPYTISQKTNLSAAGGWTKVTGPTTETMAAVPVAADGNLGVFRIESDRPDYVGGSVCRSCHTSAHDGWKGTGHEGAMETLARIGQANNSRCLPCHSVGYGLPGGFVSVDTTPRLAGVQCENCHGPGGPHVADTGDLTARPVVSLASMVCGGCHTDFHHPTYDEWLDAGHSRVHPELVTGFMNTNVVAAQSRMRSCGACHSGAVRMAMLEGNVEANQMPSGDHAANTPMTCTVCHTAHEKTEFGSQLRNPTYSTNFFSYSTSTNTSFTAQYKVDVNLCGQCHNQRGARWQDTSRPPHYSSQYNMLVGDIGFIIGNPTQSTHRDILKQCTHCHTHGHGTENPSEEEPVYTGHRFEPLPENCTPCHTPEEAEAFIGFTQRDTQAKMKELKDLLDTWGATKSPEPLRTKYGKLAWEYQNAGALSQPSTGPSVTGPTSAEQTAVPDQIKQARFFLYMVKQDGSYGVHNGRFARDILKEARKLVEGQLQ